MFTAKHNDQLSLSFESELRPDDSGKDEVEHFMVCFRINGSSDFPAVHIGELVDSAGKDGEFWIFTCDLCGYSACADIHEGIVVHHDADTVTWDVPDPVHAEWTKGDDPEPIPASRLSRYVFNRHEYFGAIGRLLAEGKRKVQAGVGLRNVEIVGFGFNVAGFLALSMPQEGEAGGTDER